jgi:hypothetical protein
MRFVYGTEVRCPSAQRGKVSALQITPALLYFRKLNLTFTVHRGSLFGTIACGKERPREQVSGVFLIKPKTLTANGG